MPTQAFTSIGLTGSDGSPVPGLVPVGSEHPLKTSERTVLDDVASFSEIDYVLFRRFSDHRSSQPVACVVDNTDEHLTQETLAHLHKGIWLNGTLPLIYIAWPTRVDVLSCAREPDFWEQGEIVYRPAEQISIASQVAAELAKRRRLSALHLADGTFWDNPLNAGLANHEQTARELLIQAVLDVDRELEGEKRPVLRRLLLLTVLIKYLEDRRVFPPQWFEQFHPGARTFFDVLAEATPERVLALLGVLKVKFNGDVFSLPENVAEVLTASVLREFAALVEARTLGRQRYLWEQFSFEHIPVEAISHLYQRFVKGGHGAVYTPPFLASLLLDYAMPYDKLNGKERILDPACGSGIFLVGAFRRLITFWRNQHDWKQPDVATLKRILKTSIFGVELDPGAVDLTAFSLALAVCDALRPNVIWNELKFDPLRERNLFERDFFECIPRQQNANTVLPDAMDIIVGNPPFESELTAAGKELNSRLEKERGRLPDKQSAYLFLEQAPRILKPGGMVCLIQPAGFLYNRQAADFRKQLLKTVSLNSVLDFVSVRGLYDGADPKTVAVVATAQPPPEDEVVSHLTFRRTFVAQQRIGFELDHYDRHLMSQEEARGEPCVWRANLLGGGRLGEMAKRLQGLRTLAEFVEEQGWISGEGFIVGNRAREAPYLTSKPFLPTDAFTANGIDESKLGRVTETHFQRPRCKELFEPPLVLIRENEMLPIAFWHKGEIAYKNEVIGVHSPPGAASDLRAFFEVFRDRLQTYRFCCLLDSRAMTGKATTILKSDIDALPYPEDPDVLRFSFWEQALADDAVEYMAPYVRLGQKSELLHKSALPADLAVYAKLFCRLLGSIYDNLKASEPIFLNGFTCQPFYFGDAPALDWFQPGHEDQLRRLIYEDCLETLRTVRVVRFYNENTMLVIKPDRLRYWIRSTAVRDADDTLVDLQQQGY